jgi:hypothetical protein
MSNGGTNDASMRSGLRFLMLGPVEARFDGRLVEIERPLHITGSGVSKTFTFHLTSASPNGDITSVGTETILPGNEIPIDCTLNYVNSSKRCRASARSFGPPTQLTRSRFTGRSD